MPKRTTLNDTQKHELCHYRTVTYSELDLALKKFMLIYQHQTILSDALLDKKAKTLADSLEIPQGALNFSSSWLYKFKNQNSIYLYLLQEEFVSANEVAISNIILVLKNIYTNYSAKRIYDMDETDSVLNDIADALNALNFFDSIQVDEFLAIPKENIVYEVPSDN
ncbi:15771_t:CDS:2 [Cetraspora pellucida]|uniref:15771_t:CDS:1 n=1 Tax=Cetraspora pellucida TaxID=1433469 RepID=A0A9N9HIZ1_9GLOM|nr:15771_t:CDS:2 [Cetraspora pellucida]